MADGSDFDSVVVFQIEEEPVFAAAETKAVERGLQFFHITGTGGEVAIQTVKNLQGRFAVDGAEISAGLWGPMDGNALRRRRFRFG